MDKELAQQKLQELVETFYENQSHYESSEYNETQCREDFINPLFTALGWDIDNKEKLPPTHRAVRLEKRIIGNGQSRSPDYSFYISKARVFVVEAKKPNVNLHTGKSAKEAAFQLRRYGWSAGLPISILTNFKEFAVYDCTKKPNEKDKPSTALLKYLTLDNYAPTKRLLYEPQNDFAYLWETFSYQHVQEKVRRGDFEREIRMAKGILTVDDAFLQFLEEWRKKFAVSIFRSNKELTEWELNGAVQQILDRIVFLRFAEDRGIELFKSLEQAINTHAVGGCYKNLYGLFEQADNKYNSGLFDTSKDHISRNLVIDNTLLKDFVPQLYFPSPYDFEAMPVEILGSAYERFLGKVIRIDSSRRVDVEEKPEVRKSGGVYYTPQYIVDYIIENTVGKLLEDKTPQEVAKIKIVDPACGSGSFLLGAYQFLLDWHHDYYVTNPPTSKSRKDKPLTPEGQLTIEEKKKILQNNIFGVDLDVNAVEFTKLSLLLKCMEGEDESTIQRLKLIHERLLPNIDGNICCGNSLIENDFYDDKDMSLWSDNDLRKINAFDWHKTFPAIFKSEGFGIVIGNPPWGQKATRFSDHEKEYLATKFPAASIGIPDLSRFFIEQSIKLLKPEGLWGQVLPDIILLKNYETTRAFLLEHMMLHSIDHWGKAFKQVNLEACTMTATKGQPHGNHSVKIGIHLKDETTIKRKIRQKFFSELPGKKFNLFLTDSSWGLLKKLSGNHTFAEFFDVHEGIHTGNVREKLFVDKKLNSKYKKLIVGGDEVQRYHLKWGKKWVHYTKEHFCENDYAGLGKPEYFECAKLVIRRTGDYVLACIDEDGYYFSNNVFVCVPKNENMDLKIFLALLNSRLLTWYYRTVQPRVGKMFAEIKINLINDFPMQFGEILSPSQNKICQRLVSLTDQMLAAQVALRNPTWGADRKSTKQRITILDNQIDALVYQLYGLTTEEIAIIEGAS